METIFYILLALYFALNCMIVGGIIFNNTFYDWELDTTIGRILELLVILLFGTLLAMLAYISEISWLQWLFSPIRFYYDFYFTSRWRNIDVRTHGFIMEKFKDHSHRWPRHQAKLIHKRFLNEL